MRINNFTPQQKVGFKAQNQYPQVINVDVQGEMLGIMAQYGEPTSRSFAKRMLASQAENTGNPELAARLNTSAARDIALPINRKIVVNADNALRASLGLIR